MLYYVKKVMAMYLKYNLDYNYLHVYDEFQGIVSYKNALYRNPYYIVSSYTKIGFKFIKLAIVEFIILLILHLIPFMLFFRHIMDFLFAITVGGIVAYYVVFFSVYSLERNRLHRGLLRIDEKGITDTSEDKVIVHIPWRFIESVIVTDNIICFMTKSITHFIINSEHYDNVMASLKKYQSDLKVLDKRTRHYHEVKEEVEDKKDEVKEEIKDKEPKEEVKEVKKETKTSAKKNQKKEEETIDDVIEAIEELTKD